jgi:hypothetical protein
MKRIFLISILSLLVIFFTISCQDKLEELYQDPDGFSKEQADKTGGVSVIAGFFTAQLTQGFFLRGEYGAAYHQMRSGAKITGTGVQLYYNTADYGLSKNLRDIEHDWGTSGFNNTVFDKVNNDWIKQVLWAQREYNLMVDEERSTLDNLFMNLLHVLKAYAYQRAIDLYDVVPYIETGSAGGLDGKRAVYLGQEDIYPKIISELKTVDDFLSGLTLTDAEQTTFKNQDVIFEGSIEKWRKYTNSLRLRCAMNVSEVKPDLTITVISELNGRPLLSEYDDVAGLADIAIVEPYRIQVELGITRAFRERADECRAPKKFLDDVMDCKPIEKSVVMNGQTLYYFEGDNSSTGLLNGDVDPRVAYIFSKDVMERYIGAETAWDDGTDPNSYYSKIMRAYYISDPVLTDPSVHYLAYGKDNQDTIKLNQEAIDDMSKRESFLLAALREKCTKYQDNDWIIGTDDNLIAEYNVVPQYNFDLRYPTIHAVETELSLAEAAVRGFGTLNGSAREHYKRAIELSCRYWYELNSTNSYSKSSSPAFPSNMDDARIERDKIRMQYDPSAYAENKAQKFDALSSQEKVAAIYDQLQLHYNFLNFETPYTAARRLIKYLGDNPANIYEVFAWKERMTYPGSVQASDPENWAVISAHNDPDIPVWLTGRTTKWKNVLE